jgi:glycosyltransferase involved in cell wall biosynthesis
VSPLVSVVIPTFDGSDFLSLTLSSVLGQTLGDLEVVMVDDASSDDTMAIAQEFAAHDTRVRIVPTTGNVGAVANWNRAVAAARGEFVKVMGQDDLLRRDCLARQVQVLQDQPTVGCVVGGRDIVDDRGRTVMKGRRPLGGATGIVSAEQALPLVVRAGTNIIGEPVTVLLRRSVMEAVGPFHADLPYVVDLDYWCRALDVAPIYVLPDTLSSFRVSATSWSAALATTQTEQMRALFARLQRERPDVITAGTLRRGWLGAGVISRARRVVYVGLRARGAAERIRRPAVLRLAARGLQDRGRGGEQAPVEKGLR